MSAFTKCLCGRTIPNDWAECFECTSTHDQWMEEGYQPGRRFHLIRAGLLQAKPQPVMSAKELESLAGIANMALQEHAHMTHRMMRRALAHDAVLNVYERMRREDQ